MLTPKVVGRVTRDGDYQSLKTENHDNDGVVCSYQLIALCSSSPEQFAFYCKIEPITPRERYVECSHYDPLDGIRKS